MATPSHTASAEGSTIRHSTRPSFGLLAALAIAVASVVPSASATTMPTTEPTSTVDAATAGSWSTLGEYRVTPTPTSLTNRSREPIVAAHPFDASRLAVVYAA